MNNGEPSVAEEADRSGCQDHWGETKGGAQKVISFGRATQGTKESLALIFQLQNEFVSKNQLRRLWQQFFGC